MTDRNFRYDLDLGGVLPYVTLTGTCGPIGYGFQGVLGGRGEEDPPPRELARRLSIWGNW